MAGAIALLICFMTIVDYAGLYRSHFTLVKESVDTSDLHLCNTTSSDHNKSKHALAPAGGQQSLIKDTSYFSFANEMHDTSNKQRPTAEFPLQTNDGHNKKPVFVIHAGPHKTATTSLQTSLSQWGDILINDNYIFLGKRLPNEYRKQSAIYKALFSDSCTDAAPKYYQAVDNNHTSAVPPPCWNNLLTELDHFKDRNLILSEERFGLEWLADDGPNPYSSLRNLARALDGHWDIVVVVGYRRLFEWIPSAKREMERYNVRKKNTSLWPSQGGKARAPLFPKYILNNPYVNQSAGTVHGYRFATDILDYFYQNKDVVSAIKVLDFHSSVGFQAEFFCNILRDSPNACSEATRRPTPVANAHDFYYAFDELTTAAAAIGWIDTRRYDRYNVTLAAQEYHQRRFSFDVSNLAKNCPPRAQLKILLGASLRLEKRVFANIDAEKSREAEQKTRNAFWKAADGDIFCSVDSEAELRKRHWEKFFSSYAPQ